MAVNPEPMNFRQLLRDHRGLPIPYQMVQNPPSQTTVDPLRFLQCAQAKLCGICGRKLGNKKWFIGGYRAMVYRHFVDMGMHEECAHYSLKTCPFLSNPNQKYHVKPAEGATPIDNVASKRNVQLLLCTKGYALTRIGNSIMVCAQPWGTTPQWWMRGEPQPALPAEAPTQECYAAYLKGLVWQGMASFDRPPDFGTPYLNWATDRIVEIDKRA